jgi:hypothetical protein
MYGPEKLLHKRKERVIDWGIFLDIILSLLEDRVKRIDDLDFDIKFEQTLFRSKLESNLKEVLFHEKKFQSLISTVPIQIIVIPSNIVQPVQNPPRAMKQYFLPSFYLLNCMIYLKIIIKELIHMMQKRMF